MKKNLHLLLVFLLVVISFAGCAASNLSTEEVAESVDLNSSSDSDLDAESTQNAELPGADSELPAADFDFTALGEIMAEAQYFNILSNAEQNLGSVIRARGAYFSLFLEETGLHYHFVTIVPGDACCRLGFEFRLLEDALFSYDYLEENSVIEVVGVLGKYELFGQIFYYLSVDDVIIF